MNPFEYGGIIEPSNFCNRRQEIHDLTRLIESRQTVFMYSERRLGKTSLIHYVLNRLDKKKFASCRVDLWTTESEISFVKAYAQAISKSLSSPGESLFESAKKWFSHLLPTLSITPEGKTSLSFQISQSGDHFPGLDSVLELPETIARKQKKTIVIAMDEFQQILSYKDSLLIQKLRSIIQSHRHVCYIFLGSRKHLMQKLFLDRSQPFYRAGTHYPLDVIGTEHWRPFLQKKFKLSGKVISDSQIDRILQITENHPFYTQHLCHELWEITGAQVRDKDIDSGLELLLKRESYGFERVWDTLTRNQKKLLYGIAHSNDAIKPLSQSFLQAFAIPSASSAQRSIEQLFEAGYVDYKKESLYITDRFFKLWILSYIPIQP